MFILLGWLHIWPNMWFGEIFLLQMTKMMQRNHVERNNRMAWYWCVFLDPFAFNGGNTSSSHNYFWKSILKRHTNNSLEVHEKWSIFQVILLLGVGNGRCIQQVFGRLSFFTNSKMPSAILVTVQTCPVTRDKAQSSEVHQKLSISQIFLLSGRVNTAEYVFWGHFLLQMAKMPIKTVITV